MAAAAVERPGAPPPPKQRYQGVQKESAGYRLMAAMGWREGEGLGASKQGIKAHIKVKKKFENWGVGAVEAAEHAQNWTNGMLDFHRVLSNLSEVVSEHAKRRASSSSSSESDSEGSGSGSDASSSSSSEDEEEQQQAQQKQQGKKRKAASSDKEQAAAEAAEAAAEPKRVRAATHIGRFKKREAAKMVKGYSEHDLAAILGEDPFAAAAAAIPEVRTQRAQRRADASSSGYDSDSEASDSDAEQQQGGKKAAASSGASKGAGKPDQQQQQAQQQQQPARPPMIVVRRPMPASCRPPQPPTPPEAREPGWWQLCFHKAQGPRGAAGAAAASGGAADGAGITIHGFSEQDQTNLYNLAHDKATKGRVGLGRSSMPKKVAGARWEGKKTRIHDSDEEDEGEAGSDGEQSAEEAVPIFQRQQRPEVGPAPAGVELEKEEGLVIILPVSKRHLLDVFGGSSGDAAEAAPAQQQQQQQQQGPAAAAPTGKKAKKAKKAAAAEQAAAAAAAQQAAAEPAAAADAVGRIKWKKTVTAALKASAKGRVKLSKLSRAVAKEQGVPKAQRPAALEALTAFLQQSSKFTLADGVVRAAS